MLKGTASQRAGEITFTAQLSEVGNSGRTRIPVAITGHWVHPATKHDILITGNDLRTAARNFRKKSNGEINVDYDHASDMPNLIGGPRPSAGRVLDLCGPEPFTDSQGTRREILWGEYEPTDMARTMIRHREYRYISPVLARGRVDKETGDSQGMTITTIALTNTPVLEEMPQIFASEEGQMLRSVEIDTPQHGLHGANEEFTAMANQRAKERGISYEVALHEVSAENPGLYKRARRAVIGNTTQYLAGSRTDDLSETGTASEILSRMAMARSKADGTEYAVALSEVHHENPELARRYQREIGRESD
jgi:hypothetical protein